MRTALLRLRVVRGKRLDRPLPRWLSDAHETYLIGQACPWWKPEDEPFDFELLVMARIHSVHENHKLKIQAQMMGAE